MRMPPGRFLSESAIALAAIEQLQTCFTQIADLSSV
jgi:hypothetical protein